MKFSLLNFLLFIVSTCYAKQDDFDQEIRSRFVVESESACKKIKAPEPRRPNTPFFSQRYYLSIDGKEHCQILDVWIQRITNLPTDNRREIYSIIYRFNGNSWVKEFGLDDKPLLKIKDRKTGIIYFFTELNEDLFYRTGIVYFSSDWRGSDRMKISSGLQPLFPCQDMPVFECQFIHAALERIIWLELGKQAF
jgi:hypothetical protein